MSLRDRRRLAVFPWQETRRRRCLSRVSCSAPQSSAGPGDRSLTVRWPHLILGAVVLRYMSKRLTRAFTGHLDCAGLGADSSHIIAAQSKSGIACVPRTRTVGEVSSKA